MDALLNILSYVFWVALALGILVFVHELGHFLFARLFGMRVDAFSIGFPPVVWRKQVGDTEYRLGAVPLGGYVKIAGMIDESLDTDSLVSEPEPDEYRSKPVWQRMLVISGGVLFNLVFAFMVFIGLTLWYGAAYTPIDNVDGIAVADSSVAYEMGLRTGDRILTVNGERPERFEDVFSGETFTADPMIVTVKRNGETVELTGPDRLLSRISRAEAFGVGYLPSAVGSVQAGSPAEEAGLRRGDRVLTIAEQDARQWPQLAEVIAESEGQPLAFRIARPDSLLEAGDPTPIERRGDLAILETTITPEARADGFVVGITNDLEYGREFRRFGLMEGIAAGSRMTWDTVSLYVNFFGRLFSGKESVRDSVGGPLMIAKQTKEAADVGLRSFWAIVGLLSIALAIFNILPIPVLDGGHLVFLLYEAITRREPSVKFRLVVQQVGMVMLLVFMVFVIFNDAVRWFG
ncbi:MAG: RIP metalloprotease RseP [Rhodothermaceae bacterium]|nr:RIP metalloprotease RseP [Rhodothermaceae bacterium]